MNSYDTVLPGADRTYLLSFSLFNACLCFFSRRYNSFCSSSRVFGRNLFRSKERYGKQEVPTLTARPSSLSFRKG